MGGVVSSRIYTYLYQRKTMNQGMAKISCKDSPYELHEVDERLICVKCGKKLGIRSWTNGLPHGSVRHIAFVNVNSAVSGFREDKT